MNLCFLADNSFGTLYLAARLSQQQEACRTAVRSARGHALNVYVHTGMSLPA